MKESKWGILICSLCLLLAFSAPALGQQKQEKPKLGAALTPAQAKARAEAAKREQRNQEFIAAVDAGDVGASVKLLAAGADVNSKNREGMTALMHAALNGSPELTQLLLRKGAQVNVADVFGITALMQASWAGHVEVVDMLLAAGANPDLQSIVEIPRLRKAGVTALIGASMNGNLEVAKVLLDRGARVNQQDAGGQTALMHASQGNFPQVAGLLLSRGAKTEIKDQFGRTALTDCDNLRQL